MGLVGVVLLGEGALGLLGVLRFLRLADLGGRRLFARYCVAVGLPCLLELCLVLFHELFCLFGVDEKVCQVLFHGINLFLFQVLYL